MEQQHEIESEMSAVSSNNEMDNPIHDANSLGADAKTKAIVDSASAFGFKESLGGGAVAACGFKKPRGGGGSPGQGTTLSHPRQRPKNFVEQVL